MTPRELNNPQPGYWLIRKGRNTPLVPARIYLTDAEPGAPDNKLDRWPLPILAAEIAGKVVDPYEVWHRKGQEISEAEFKFRMMDIAWLREHQPDAPELSPDKPVRIKDIPLQF